MAEIHNPERTPMTTAPPPAAAADPPEMKPCLPSQPHSPPTDADRDFLDDLTLKEIDNIELRSRCDLLARYLAAERYKTVSLSAKLAESETDKRSLREEAEKHRTACDHLEAAKITLDDDWKRKCASLEARLRRLEEDNSRLRARERVVKEATKIIEISDSEDDAIVGVSACKSSAVKLQLDEKNVGAMEDYDYDDSKSYLFSLTPKRKCNARVITSDSEEDEDDKIPLSKLKQRKLGDADDCSCGYSDIKEDVTPSRKRLVLLRELEETDSGARVTSRDSTPKIRSTDAIKRDLRNKKNVCRRVIFAESEGVEDYGAGSESEGESLDGFIVEDSGSESKYSSDAASEEAGQSDSDVDLNDVLAKIHRKKNVNKWEYQTDMLSAFAKSDELCMKAVCVLWQFQTDEEKEEKQTKFINHKGFNKLDAARGSIIAEFLTDGDPYGPVTKTVKQLKEFDSDGVEYCRKLAFRYSKQLFEHLQGE